MERIKSVLSNLIESQKQRHEATMENQRKARVAKHPHAVGCTGCQDIEYFDKEYTGFDGGAWGMSGIILQFYSTRCTECGETDYSHARKR